MKKLIIVFTAALSVILAGCEIDNYDAPTSVLSGTVVYNGDPVGVRTNGTQFELWQDGYDFYEKIPVHIAQDGTYSARLFNGKYKLVRLGGAPWEAQSSDTIVVDVNGDTVKDIEVDPFYTISEESFEVKGNAVVANFTVNQIDLDASLSAVKLFFSKRILLDDNQKDLSVDADISTITSGNQVSVVATLPQSLSNEDYFFARVGVRSNKSNEFYYTQVTELAGDPNGPKNPTADFTYEVNGTTVSFTSITENAVGFAWDFGDGETSTEENPVHVYAQGGEYTVKLTVTGAEGSIDAQAEYTFNAGAVSIAVENYSFELPGTGRIFDWAGVPGWNSDTTAEDSGVENAGRASDGDWSGVLMNTDPSTWNLTDYVISGQEQFKLTVDVFDIWYGGSDFVITLYYDTGDGNRKVLNSSKFNAVGAGMELTASATEAAVGARIGIELDLQSAGDPGSGGGWSAIDNVRLTAE